jgi:hypothetical protein
MAMTTGYQLRMLTVCCFFALAGTAFAEGPPESGFLDDYSRLEPAAAPWADYVFVTDAYAEEMSRFQAIIIPQPELFVSPDSKYKGMKPDNMKVITDSMQQLFAEAFVDGYQIANSPGPNTVMLRMAFSNLYLKRKPRIPVVGWLPPAYVLTTAKRQLRDDFTDNILLTELVWEAELRDSETGEILGQIIVELGDRQEKKQFTSWDELIIAVAVGAERLRCRFDNAPLLAAQQRDCFEITEADIDLGN